MPFLIDLKQTDSNGKVYYRMSTNVSLLRNAKDIINAYPRASTFEPTVLIIATWHEVTRDTSPPDPENKINGVEVSKTFLHKLIGFTPSPPPGFMVNVKLDFCNHQIRILSYISEGFLRLNTL